MGTIIHKAMCITSWHKETIEKLHAIVDEEGIPVTEIHESPVNSYFTFFVIPSGSKYGWEAQKQHDKNIEFVIDRIDDMAFENEADYIERKVCWYGNDWDEE